MRCGMAQVSWLLVTWRFELEQVSGTDRERNDRRDDDKRAKICSIYEPKGECTKSEPYKHQDQAPQVEATMGSSSISHHHLSPS